MGFKEIFTEIQLLIRDTADGLEKFTDPVMEPSEEECVSLREKLTALNDKLAIYAYLSQNQSRSGEFALHSRISEAVQPPKVVPHIPEVTAQEQRPRAAMRSFTVPINDKFLFINELFARNGAEYQIAIEQINAVNSWDEARIYLGSLGGIYGWEENNDTLKHFYSLVRQSFG
jgi:hypothetical protein